MSGASDRLQGSTASLVAPAVIHKGAMAGHRYFWH